MDELTYVTLIKQSVLTGGLQMKLSIKLLILCCLLFSFQYAFSGIVGDTQITGRVLKYNKRTVTISQYRNKKVTVPRSSLKKNSKKLKTGMMVTAVFSPEEIMDQIQEQTKKK